MLDAYPGAYRVEKNATKLGLACPTANANNGR